MKTFFILVILFGLLIYCLSGWYVGAAQNDILGIKGGNASIAQLGEGVEVYRVIDGNTTCYVAVGRLHGYTVAIDCVR